MVDASNKYIHRLGAGMVKFCGESKFKLHLLIMCCVVLGIYVGSWNLC